MQNLLTTLLIIFLLVSCGVKKAKSADEIGENVTEAMRGDSLSGSDIFSADSAYAYLKKQVDFGPRVPNTEAHRLAGDWLSAKLRSYGAQVKEQRVDLRAFDGTTLHARNIFAQFNPQAEGSTLLLAHYDCRPWADQDPDPEKRSNPVDGANDGASGVAVLLEIARQLSLLESDKGIDILFVDAEDWGTDGDDESWALGARHFVNNPVIEGYAPSEAILLDMVGGRDAKFPVEYFSQQNAPGIVNAIWNIASQSGYASQFPKRIGTAVTDDHIEFIKAGIPAVDIIEYQSGNGFNPHWHTTTDNLDNIDINTLKAVGETVMIYLLSP